MNIKKLAIVALAGITIASCNREVEGVDSGIGNRIKVKSGSEISHQMHAMDETVTITNKAGGAPLSYTYKSYAEAPEDLDYTDESGATISTGVRDLAQATAVFPVDDFLFVTWHLEDHFYGGAVSCYRYDNVQQTYTYVSVAEFDDTDFHELVATKNSLTSHYEVFVVGQRSPSTSGYLLNNHKGAIVGKLLFNYITNTFEVGDYKELPLPGYGADDIFTSAGRYYISTGNGTGAAGSSTGSGLFKTDGNLTLSGCRKTHSSLGIF